MDLLHAFSPDYVSARGRFRDAVRQRGLRSESIPLAGAGPGGEALAMDVAWVDGGPGRARGQENLLIVSSGLHGIEGGFGSAAQLHWLESGTVGAGGPVLLIHALNPWGFAQCRRADRENIDLNRNFFLPGDRPGPGNADYRALNAILNPPRPPGRLDPLAPRLAGALLRQGRRRLTQAIAGGQYEFPRGLFFGGSGESETARLLREHLPRWVGAARRIVHLDLHTGLGARGTLQLLCDLPLDDEDRNQGRLLAGDASFPLPCDYQARGTLGAWARAVFADRRYLTLVAEFGAYGSTRTLAALRAENQAHWHCAADDPRRLRAGRRLLETFCPADPVWRRQTIARASELISGAAESIGTVAAASSR